MTRSDNARRRRPEDRSGSARNCARRGIAAIALAAATLMGAAPAHAASGASSEGAAGPTVVLVHGAWEQASSWSLVAERLRARGYRVVAPEIRLRSLASDATAISDVVGGIAGPVVLAGHSYGGSVISNAAVGHPNVTALVFIAAFAPDRGESIFQLDLHDPGALVAPALVPVPFVGPGANVGTNLYINALLYRSVLAGDVPEPAASEMAATQRPVTQTLVLGGSAEPAWKTIPSWYLVATEDRAIAPATERFMARRAHATTVEVASSHAAPVSRPDAVADVVRAAARGAGGPASRRPARARRPAHRAKAHRRR
jgi:pimeloyl-ACP methyl ester carboxylesterase